MTTRSTSNTRHPLKLYWLETTDHDEDWFVVARTAREARLFFEDQEGYARGDATSSHVLRLPKELQFQPEPGTSFSNIAPIHAPCWPSEALIKACGGVYLMKGDVRVVQIGESTYAEGLLEREVNFARRGRSSFEGPSA